MKFTSPIQFEDAINLHSVQTEVASSLDSAQWSALKRELPDSIKHRGFVSSQVERYDTLRKLHDVIGNELNREAGSRDPRTAIREFLDSISYDVGDRTGTIKDLRTSSRLDVLLNTNKDISYGYGYYAAGQGAASINDWPAWELYRSEARKDPRDWEQRWKMAARSAADNAAYRVLDQTGRMVALKDSAIWHHLGSDFEDSLGNPFPPFAWGSGMDIEEIDRSETEALGLITPDATIKPRPLENLNAALEIPVEQRDAALFKALADAVAEYAEIKNGVLTLK